MKEQIPAFLTLVGVLSLIAIAVNFGQSHFQNVVESIKPPPVVSNRIAFSGMQPMISKGPLIKSKSCDSISTIELYMKPSEVILTESATEVKVFINGKEDKRNQLRLMKNRDIALEKKWIGEEEYNSKERKFHGTFVDRKNRLNMEKRIWTDLFCSIDLPPYSQYEQDKLSIEFKLVVDGEIINSMTDTIRYVKDGETAKFSNKSTIYSPGGSDIPSYFKNETLYPIKKEGLYSVNKTMISTVSRDQGRLKIVTNSPAGYMVHEIDTTYKIPLPAFPEIITYADTTCGLVEGRYEDPYFGNLIYAHKDAIGKYIGYNYDDELVEMINTVVFNGCTYERIGFERFTIPQGIHLKIVDYPSNIQNEYISME